MPQRDSKGTTDAQEDASTEPDGADELLDHLHGHIDEIHRELAVQVKRTLQIQEQLDELRLKLQTLAGKISGSSSREPGAAGRDGDGPPVRPPL